SPRIPAPGASCRYQLRPPTSGSVDDLVQRRDTPPRGDQTPPPDRRADFPTQWVRCGMTVGGPLVGEASLPLGCARPVPPSPGPARRRVRRATVFGTSHMLVVPMFD